MLVSQPLVLFIDAYDSFSNNIISLLETTLSCSVRTVKIDDARLVASDAALREELSHYAAVVCGPGPGHPGKEQDIGIIKKIWQLGDEELLPVLGICLGFQSLCLEFGADVKRLSGPQHGIIRRVVHVGEHILLGNGTVFEGVGDVTATHYQSLNVDIGQGSIEGPEWEKLKWAPSPKCPSLIPLAYVESNLSIPNDSGVKDDRVLVAVQHSSKPFWALQYHPESICTGSESHKVITNWFHQAQIWNKTRRAGRVALSQSLLGAPTVRQSLLSRSGLLHDYLSEFGTSSVSSEVVCYTKKIALPETLALTELVEAVSDCGQDQVIFESTNTNEKLSGTADVRGRFSIVALDINASTRFEYAVGGDAVKLISNTGFKEVTTHIGLEEFGGIWPFLAQYLERSKVTVGDIESPFWGGFMGYTSYELGLESINVESTAKKNSRSRPDLCFVWVTRSIVVDHFKKVIYIQDLSPSYYENLATSWIDTIVNRLDKVAGTRHCGSASPTRSLESEYGRDRSVDTPLSTPPQSASSSSTNLLELASRRRAQMASIQKPTDSGYESRVLRCQDYISSGDSYELCLTDQTVVTRQKPASPHSSWNLYTNLRARQPAPFASYIRLGGATLVSSSPERFLTWDHNNRCSLRPMKGTVKKTAAVDTLEKAKRLLEVPKEKAENLMIVDLVRHDLHGVCGSGNVDVPRLCVVEEYKSVFQMISVVEGQVPASDPCDELARHTGFDVLAASLPPGSMTGAPKKRSCEILQGIEAQERGLYSGVVGYYDVRGRGDWSVTIRSMFKWDDETVSERVVGAGGEAEMVDMEKWHIGAGGAVTTLSTAVGEREEMQTKLNGTLGLFL